MSLFLFVFAANDHRVDFLSDGLGAGSACSGRDEDQGPGRCLTDDRKVPHSAVFSPSPLF